jgi:two-component Ni(II)/redox sensor kinase NrsS
MALITVKDTGIGIPPEKQDQIFERFYRVDGDRSRKTGGTGLGLAIAQAIAQRHHGQITVQSEVGRGSIFTVHLPSAPE